MTLLAQQFAHTKQIDVLNVLQNTFLMKIIADVCKNIMTWIVGWTVMQYIVIVGLHRW